MDRKHKARALMGRAIATGLAAATLLGGVATANAATFRDVTDRTPHHDDIIWLAGRDITTGYGDGTFRGMNAIARQDMAAFLYRMAGSPAFDADKALDAHPFKDVDRSTPHWRAVLWTASTGIAKGYEDGTFGGMRTVVRQDMAAMLHRYVDWTGIQPAQGGGIRFTDLDHVAHRADVEWFGTTGIARGFTDGTFGGMRQVVRQDMAAFLHRLAAKKPTQGQLNAAKKAVEDAQARVDEAKKTADAAKADADNAQAQWDQGSLGFYKAMGWQQALDVFSRDDIKEQAWFRKDPQESGTSLPHMQRAIVYMELVNQKRTDAGTSPMEYVPRLEALAQAQVDWSLWKGGMQHQIYDAGQCLAGGYAPVDAWYSEKPVYDQFITEHPEAKGMSASEVSNKYPDSFPKFGHYMILMDASNKYMGIGDQYDASNEYYGNVALNTNDTKDFVESPNYENVMSVSDYKTKLTAYVDGLTKRINAHKDAQQALDKANATLTQAQAKLDALTTMTA